MNGCGMWLRPIRMTVKHRRAVFSRFSRFEIVSLTAARRCSLVPRFPLLGPEKYIFRPPRTNIPGKSLENGAKIFRLVCFPKTLHFRPQRHLTAEPALSFHDASVDRKCLRPIPISSQETNTSQSNITYNLFIIVHISLQKTGNDYFVRNVLCESCVQMSSMRMHFCSK